MTQWHLVVSGSLLAAWIARSQRLRVVNACPTESLWIAHEAGGSTGVDKQNRQVQPGKDAVFTTSNGLAATRSHALMRGRVSKYWAKMRCDAGGFECLLGGSGGPGQVCVREKAGGLPDYSHCAPPVDSQLRASFGVEGLPCSPQHGLLHGCDHLVSDLSRGYTLPFRLDLNGSCVVQDAIAISQVDCRNLSLANCPTDEKVLREQVSSSLVLRDAGMSASIGCYSPCGRLNDGNSSREAVAAAALCCPESKTSSCDPGSQESSYMEAVHSMCKGLGAGDERIRCTSSARYTLTFYCPRPALPSLKPPALLPRQWSSEMHVSTGDKFWFAFACMLSAVTVVAAVSAVAMDRKRTRRLRYSSVPQNLTSEELLTLEDQHLPQIGEPDVADREGSVGIDRVRRLQFGCDTFPWALTTC